MAPGRDTRTRARRSARPAGRREARRLALAAIFEAEFGQRTATAILERHLAEAGTAPAIADLARELVQTTVDRRDRIDAEIERVAPQYPVVQLARIDRALLRLGLSEVLHSATTPARVAIAEWVEMARIYSGDPARRLVNGVLGRIARDSAAALEGPEAGPEEPRGREPSATSSEEGVRGHDIRSAQEDRRRAAGRRRGRGDA